MTDTLPTPRRQRATRKSKWPPGIYVGRPRKWGNPFIVGRDGTAEECVAQYEALLCGDGLRPTRSNKPRVTPDMARVELAGHDLLCWCPLDRPCHADVLLEIANQPRDL